MAKNHTIDNAVDNPAPASSALVLMNPGGGESGGSKKGIMGYVNQAIPMLKIGGGVAGGYIGSNMIRGNVSAKVAGMFFGEDKVTPGQALAVDWVFQLATAILGYKLLPKAIGLSFAGGIVANTVLASAKQLMPTKPGQQPNLLQKNMDLLVFRPTAPPPAAGIMAMRNRSLAGIMPRVMRY